MVWTRTVHEKVIVPGESLLVNKVVLMVEVRNLAWFLHIPHQAALGACSNLYWSGLLNPYCCRNDLAEYGL